METKLIKVCGGAQKALFMDLMIEFSSKVILNRGAKHTEVQKRYIEDDGICGIVDETIHKGSDGEIDEIIYEVALSKYYAGFIQYMIDNNEARLEQKRKTVKSSRALL